MKESTVKKFAWGNILCLTLTWTSCSDTQLAEAIDGEWTNTQQLTDEEGIVHTETTRYSFNYIDNKTKDGGRFVERTYIKQNCEEDGMVVSCCMSAFIKGEWEFIWGNLYMTYNLASLRVIMDDFNINLTKDASYNMLLGMAGITLFEGLTDTDLLDKDGMSKEIKNKWYQELHQIYESNNKNEACFTDVKINDNIMTVGTDEGKLRFYRVSQKQ